MTALQFFIFTALPVTGMCYAVLGALKLPLSSRLNIDEAKVGGLLSAFGIMVGPIILAAGFLSDSLGRQGVWIGGSILVTLALLLLSQAKQYRMAVISVILMSTGWAAMVNVVNPVMVDAIKNPVTAVNTGDFLFGFGAFCTPAIVAFLIRKTGYRITLITLAGSALFVLILGFIINLQPNAMTAPSQPAGDQTYFDALIKDPVMWFCALILMLWAPLESVTAAWTTSFVSQQKPNNEESVRSEKIAAWTLSGFWMCFMGSRLVMAMFHQFQSEGHDSISSTKVLHILLSILAIFAMLGLVISKKRKVTIIIILAMGLISGPFVPGVIAILLSHVQPEVSGRAVGIAFAGASIGWTLIPLLIGKTSSKTGSLHKGFLVAVVTAVLLLGFVLAHKFYV